MIFEELLLCGVLVITQPTFSCSKSTMETPERYVESVQGLQKRYQNDVKRRSVVLTVNFEQKSHIALAFP